MAETRNVAVLIYPGVEVIDMNGPIDVFMKANRYTQNSYQVFTVAESAGDIESEGSCVHPAGSASPGPCIQDEY